MSAGLAHRSQQIPREKGRVGFLQTTLDSSLYIVNAFSFLAFLSLGIFGMLQFLDNDPALGIMELAGSGASLLNAIGVMATRNTRLAKNLLLCIILTMLMIMLITGGTKNTGIFWFFVFPVGAFFLVGRRAGWYWMLALGVAILTIIGLEFAGVTGIAYSLTTVRQLAVSLLVVTLGIYVYEQDRENLQARMITEREELDQAKNEFLTLASHQLRTPISAIKWSSEILLHGDAGPLSDGQKEYMQQVYQSNQRSASIVDAIITISHLQAGSLPVRLEEVDVQTLCHEIVQELRTNLSELTNDRHIEQHFDANLPKILCDEALMRTIIRNLLSNAIKYTPKGGHITLNVGTSVEKLKSKASKGSLRIAIEDTGYGVPKAQQAQIFDKLFRASNVKTKDTDGTGLGLYIVKQVLNKVGGSISFASQEGKGSTFTVLLPLEGMAQNKASNS